MTKNIVMLCGGVGGARAALALYENYPQENLSFLVNTGDDFQHLGLEIWPDWDTVVYHLAGLQEPTRGWGRRDEGTRVMEELKVLEGPTWFHLGDRDLALHLYRTWAHKEGETRAELAEHITSNWQIPATVLPLTEGSAQTQLRLESGEVMDFQEWFVKAQCQPRVRAVENVGLESLCLTQGVVEAFENSDLIIMAPSNPYLSLGPMLKHPELQQCLRQTTTKKIAISPLIDGKALKGPLDRLISDLSSEKGQNAIASFWEGQVDALLLPDGELENISIQNMKILPCPTLLKTMEDRAIFARALLSIWENHL